MAFGIQLDFPSIYCGNNSLSTALEQHDAISQIKEPTYSIILPWALGKQIGWFHNFPGSVQARKVNLEQNLCFIVENTVIVVKQLANRDSFMFIKTLIWTAYTLILSLTWRGSTTRKKFGSSEVEKMFPGSRQSQVMDKRRSKSFRVKRGLTEEKRRSAIPHVQRTS